MTITNLPHYQTEFEEKFVHPIQYTHDTVETKVNCNDQQATAD